jgi:hypothetical protein
MVEGFFRGLTQNRLCRGVFRELEELIMAIGIRSTAITTAGYRSSGPRAPPIFWKTWSALVNLLDSSR